MSWNHICKDKSKGGLGVRGIEDFNMTLLSKWKWRLLIDKKAIWVDVLRARYGNFEHTILIGDFGDLRVLFQLGVCVSVCRGVVSFPSKEVLANRLLNLQITSNFVLEKGPISLSGMLLGVRLNLLNPYSQIYYAVVALNLK